MAEQDYKEKIRKLLALAESSNEHEAKAALLKAKQLMAEHKISELDIVDVEKQEVKNVMTDITCSKRRNPWVVELSAIIGENYCCKAYRNHRWGEQTQRIGFIGLEDDIEICIAIFKYAVDCILAGEKKLKKEMNDYGYSGDYIKTMLDSYGFGFTRGIKSVFYTQKQEHQEWGLVMVMPKEVEEASSHLAHKSFESKAADNISKSAYYLGRQDGKNFSPEKRLQEA